MADNSVKKPGISDGLNTFILKIGRVTAWANVLLIVAIIIQVTSRYIFNTNFIKLEELQWHLYAVTIMIGLSYASARDRHIRLDVLYSGFSNRTKEYIEIFGILFLLMPVIFVFFIHSFEFVSESWRVSECSDAPTGLCYRWIIKSVIPFSFLLLFITAIARLMKAFTNLGNRKKG